MRSKPCWIHAKDEDFLSFVLRFSFTRTFGFCTFNVLDKYYRLFKNGRLLSLDIYDCRNYLCAVKCLKTNDLLFSSIDSMTWLLKNSICLKLMELHLFKWRRYFNAIIFETLFGKRLKLWYLWWNSGNHFYKVTNFFFEGFTWNTWTNYLISWVENNEIA